MSSTKLGPAHPSEDDGEARRDLLGSSSSNTPSLDQLQAPDDAGESDLDYFTKRKLARTRIRSAFPGEFPRKLLKPGNGRPAVVIVGMLRDDTGRPTTRVRSIVFPEGGSA
jgi:hypothetical protein